MFLCTGGYQKCLLEDLFTDFIQPHIVEIGYPRLDNYFIKQYDKNYLSSKFGLNPNLETILWLPDHHDNQKIIESYSDILPALSKQYNILLKPHPDCWYNENREALLMLEQSDHVVIAPISPNDE